MKDWGIKKRVLFIALLPAILIAISLASYFNYTQIINLENNLHDRGKLITDQLSAASEYGVFSSNIDILDHLITKAMSEMDDIIEITITDNYGETLSFKHNPSSHTKMSEHESMLHFLASQFVYENNIEFHSLVTTTEIEINDYTESLINPDNNNQLSEIGHIKLSLTNHLTREKQLVSVIRGIFITLIGLILTTIFAIRISASVINPIRKLTDAVNDIAHNKLDAHLTVNSGGEIGSLERGLNKMADEIRSSRTTLEQQVKQATLSLTKTLDELEIQNIELDIARNQALSASKIKSEFLANMSHEIRTPMNGVIGFTDLLAKTTVNDQQKDYIRTIENSARNLLTIIDDILDFSKIESGKLRIEDISFDIAEVMNDIATMFTPMAYNKNIEIIRHPLPRKIPESLVGDPTRLRQILVNLISNAIKFTHEGHVSIKTKIIELTDDTIHLHFSVKDTGIGLSNESKQQLFKSFTQADSSISRRFGGTGLGLVICKNLTELMHGDIGFDSDITNGSTFWFSIKFTTLETKIPNDIYNDLTNKTALIYEDSNEALDATSALIKSMNFNIITTQDHNSITEILNDKKIDLLALGISRSNIRNKQFLNEISVISRIINNTIVIASSFSNTELQSILDIGINNVIFRSSPESSIKTKIHNIIQGLSESTNHHTDITKKPSHRDLSYINALIVDDNEINLKLAQTILENNSIQTTTARNGQDALNFCSSEYFDIILMDLHMPVMNGFKTIENIRHSNNSCQKSIIIALTANASPEDKQKAFNAGVNDILIKPFNENQIFNILEHCLPDNINERPKELKNADESISISSHLYDYSAAVTLAGGSEKLANELLSMLIAELPLHKSKIQQARKLNDPNELRHAVHKLHGGAKYCAAEELSASAGKLETLIIQNNTADIDLALDLVYENIENLISYYKQMKHIKPLH